MAFRLHDLYAEPDAIVVTAHRGWSAAYPENTLEAFQAAVQLGADILEFDLRGTKDGVPIVLHDATFERTANRPGAPADYSLSEIKTFEASYWQGSHESGIRLPEPAMPGVGIPTFEELLIAVGPNVGLNIQVYDTSPAVLGEICRLYRAYDLYERGYLTLPGFADGEWVRRVDGSIELCILERQGRMDLEVLRRMQDFGVRYVQPLRHDVTPELCAAARAMGLYTNVFYGNTDEDNRMLIAMGVSGILTDRPDVLLATLRAMGRR